MSLVKGRRNPVIGELVIAEVVLKSVAEQADAAILRNQILEICRRVLPPYKVPAALRFVPGLEITPSGKLARA